MGAIFLVSVHGDDKPGTLNGLAKLTHQHQGKWLSSKVINLDGQFASLIRVEVEAQQEAALRQALLDYPELQISISEVATTASERAQVSFKVDAQDRPGLVNDITHVLLNHDANVLSMDCQRFQVPEAGTSVFSAEFEVEAPVNMDKQTLVEELEEIQEQLIVNQA